MALPAVVAPRVTAQAQAQSFRFNLRAEPDVITANGISTTSILVQVQNGGGNAISAAPMVRFVTSAGSIEPQARLSGGFARVLLRSSTTPGTAIVTAIVGSSREQIAVEFSSDDLGVARYLQVSGKYVAYGSNQQHITASGQCSLDFGDLHIESDVRLDVDMTGERVWAEGGSGRVLIRNGSGSKVHELRGDRLFYDLRRRRGVMRRGDTSLGPARQEFMDSDFRALPDSVLEVAPPKSAAPAATQPAAAQPSAATADMPNPVVPSVPDKSTLTPALRPDTDTAPIVVPQAPSAAPPEESTPLEGIAPKATTPEATTPKATTPKATTPAPIQPSPSGVSATIRAIEPVTRVVLQQNPGLATPVNPDATTKVLSPAAGDGSSTTRFGSFDGERVGGNRLAVLNPELGQALPSGALPGSGLFGTTLPGVNLLAPRTENKPGSGEPIEQTLPSIPSYSDLPSAPDANAVTTGDQSTLVRAEPKIVEPMPPDADVTQGYWVVARRTRVFPHDKVQFEHATVFFNGRKLFAMPRYVASLNGAFNPATDMMAFNTQGGLTLNVPYYYQASPRGTGTLYFQHAPGRGFAAEKPGFALALDQQYWMSERSQGRVIVDQIGRGGWNLNWEHKMQFSPTARGELYFDMPRHRDAYLRSSFQKDFRSMQIGFEGLMSRVSSSSATSFGRSNMQGQFFARLRPKTLGRSGWNYTLAANLIAVRRFAYLELQNGGGGTGGGGTGGGTGGDGTGGGGTGGGIGLPGRGGSRSAIETAMQMAVMGRTAGATGTVQRTRPMIGQTLLATLQAPTRNLWKGASVQSSLLASAFNYSDGRRGVAPGLMLGFRQELGRSASLQLDYNYDKGSLGFLNSISNGNYTHFMSGSLLMNLGSKVSGNAYFTKSLADGSLYGAVGLDFYPSDRWRMGLFSDYSSFDAFNFLNYGLTIGRQIGQREISLNWSRDRNKFFFELGNSPF
ncbi:MAG: hypothetical protein JWN98_345 [Abditibacteriota bacterium]|nr:hypothetical protein [Abditibacteriota bacterium]